MIPLSQHFVKLKYDIIYKRAEERAHTSGSVNRSNLSLYFRYDPRGMMVKCPHLASPFLIFNERTLWKISTLGNLFQKYIIVSMMPPNLLYSTTSYIYIYLKEMLF